MPEVSLHKRVLLLLVALASGVVSPAIAVPLTGQLEGTGAMRFTMNTIDFQPTGGGQGDFLGIGGFGTLGSLTLVPGHIGDLDVTVQPIGTPFLTPQWMTFDAELIGHTIPTLDLTFIDPGVYSAADCFTAPHLSQVCTPPGSMFNFQNSGPDSSILTFRLRGLTVGRPGELRQFESIFFAEFPSYFDQILAILDGGGFVETTYLSLFIADPSTVPEPGAVSLLVAGTLVVLRRTRRT
jgi:hypothetical protein